MNHLQAALLSSPDDITLYAQLANHLVAQNDHLRAEVLCTGLELAEDDNIENRKLARTAQQRFLKATYPSLAGTRRFLFLA